MISSDEFRSGNFKEIIIEELDKYCVVTLITEDGKELSFRDDKDGNDRIVSEVVAMFLAGEKINKVANRLPSIRNAYEKKYLEVSSLANRNLKICLYNINSRHLFNMILNKYVEDRYEFMENDDIKEIKLDSKKQKFMYEMENGCANITLCVDNNENIISSEREVMMKYLYNKFDMIGEEVKIEIITNQSGLKNEIVITCGDFKVSFPQSYTYSTIVGIVNAYNNEINNNRKR